MTEHNDATPLSVSELEIMCEDIENRMTGFDCYSVSVTFNAAEEHRCTLVFSNQLGQLRTLQIIGDCPVAGVGDGTIHQKGDTVTRWWELPFGGWRLCRLCDCD